MTVGQPRVSTTTFLGAGFVLALVCVGACGGKTVRAPGAVGTATATLPQIELPADDDLDSDAYKGERDVDHVLFPRIASPVGAHAATLVVKRYFAVAARDDGAAACSLMYSALAEATAVAYERETGTPAARNEACAVAVSSVFARMRRQLRAESATLRVDEVRVLGRQASVRVTFAAERPSRYVSLERERGAWRVSRILPIEQPAEVE
jgi:hypothetical protein